MDFEQELKSYSNFPKYSNFLASTCNAPTRSFKIKYVLADLFSFCFEYKKTLYKIPIGVSLTRRFDNEVNQFLFHSAAGDTNSRCKMGIPGQVALNDPAQNPHLGNECTQ